MSCICVDGDNKRILDILPNRRLNTIIRYFMQFPASVRQRVRYLVMDMNAHYQKLLNIVFPNAQLVTDRFHIIQHINRSFNQLRIQVMKQFKTNTREYRRLKRFWKHLLMDAYNLNSTQWQYNHSFRRLMTQASIVDELLSYDDTLKRAYRAVQQFKDAYRQRDTTAFFEAIDHLYQRLPFAFRSKFNIFYRFKQGIENAFNCHYSNGITEGTNNKIKVIKRVAYGYRNFHYFRLRILINQSYFLFGA